MKFKLFRLDWDFTVPLQMLWVFYGSMMCLIPFMFEHLSGVAIAIWTVLVIITMATGDSINKKLMDQK